MGKIKLLLSDFQLRKASSRCFGRKRPEIDKINIDYAVHQCFSALNFASIQQSSRNIIGGGHPPQKAGGWHPMLPRGKAHGAI